jgi:hypothetical protein
MACRVRVVSACGFGAGFLGGAMNRFRAWGVGAALGALVAGAAAPVVAADPPLATAADDRPGAAAG